MWILFSILAALCWSVINIVDKYVLTKWIKHPSVPIVILSILGVVASIIVFSVRGLTSLSYLNIFLVLLAGIFHLLAYVFYFKALKGEEVSRIVPLFYLSPVFVLFLAAIFLDEVFAPITYLGIFLLIIGAILISLKNFSKISFNKSFWLMILSAIVLSVNSILIKHLLNFTDYWTIFAYERIGILIGAIPIIYLYMPELINTVKEYGKKVVIVLSSAEILNLLAVLFITIATSVGYVTLVNALSSVQPLFVLLFTVTLSIFYPSILKEEISKSAISLKLLAIVLMFIGAILIT
jgi:drug/metabolite transporter (DMT)-like permease